MKNKKKTNLFDPEDWPLHLRPDRFSQYLEAQGIVKTENTLATERSRKMGFSYKKIGGRIYYERSIVQQEINNGRMCEE